MVANNTCHNKVTEEEDMVANNNMANNTYNKVNTKAASYNNEEDMVAAAINKKRDMVRKGNTEQVETYFISL